MDDPLLVRVLDGVADLDEKRDAPGHKEVLLVAVVGDLHAAHQLHDEVGPPGFGGARVEHPRDVGMVHHGQRLALGLEAGDDLPGVHAEPDDLEGDAPADRLLLLGHVDHTAAALADLLEQLVAADPGLDSGLRRRECAGPGGVRPVGHRRRFQKVADFLVDAQKRLNPLEEFGVTAACLLQIVPPLRHRQRERGGKQSFFA